MNLKSSLDGFFSQSESGKDGLEVRSRSHQIYFLCWVVLILFASCFLVYEWTALGIVLRCLWIAVILFLSIISTYAWGPERQVIACNRCQMAVWLGPEQEGLIGQLFSRPNPRFLVFNINELERLVATKLAVTFMKNGTAEQRLYNCLVLKFRNTSDLYQTLRVFSKVESGGAGFVDLHLRLDKGWNGFYLWAEDFNCPMENYIHHLRDKFPDQKARFDVCELAAEVNEIGGDSEVEVQEILKTIYMYGGKWACLHAARKFFHNDWGMAGKKVLKIRSAVDVEG